MNSIHLTRIVDLDDRLWYYTEINRNRTAGVAIIEQVKLQLLKRKSIPYGLN